MEQEASCLCPIGGLTESGQIEPCMGHVTHALMTRFLLRIKSDLENSTGALDSTEIMCLCNGSDPPDFWGSRWERLETADVWDIIGLCPRHAAFCWHAAGTQLAIRLNRHNYNIRNAWRRRGVKTEKKRLKL